MKHRKLINEQSENTRSNWEADISGTRSGKHRTWSPTAHFPSSRPARRQQAMTLRIFCWVFPTSIRSSPRHLSTSLQRTAISLRRTASVSAPISPSTTVCAGTTSHPGRRNVIRPRPSLRACSRLRFPERRSAIWCREIHFPAAATSRLVSRLRRSITFLRASASPGRHPCRKAGSESSLAVRARRVSAWEGDVSLPLLKVLPSPTQPATRPMD